MGFFIIPIVPPTLLPDFGSLWQAVEGDGHGFLLGGFVGEIIVFLMKQRGFLSQQIRFILCGDT